MIKTLLLDLGNVIVGLDFERAYRAVAGLTNYETEEIPEVIRRTALAETYERGEISSRVFYEQFTQAFGLEVSFERFCALWEDMFHPQPLLPEAFLEALHKRYRLVLLSNTNELHLHSIRDRFGLLQHFDDCVVSYEVGALKPDKKIYDAALQRAQCQPNECFFTDDRLDNVQAAQRIGIDAVQFENAPQLESELRRRNVVWK